MEDVATNAIRSPPSAVIGPICVGDNLEGRCFDVARGRTERFNQKQGAGEPITVTVIVSGGGSATKQFFDSGATLDVLTAGDAAKPVIR